MANFGSFIAGFQHTCTFGSQTTDLGIFMATTLPLLKVALQLLTTKFMGVEGAMKLPTLVVSWPVMIGIQSLMYVIKYLINTVKLDPRKPPSNFGEY